MPIYTYQCDHCGRQDDDYRPMEKRNEPMRCPQLDGATGPCPGLMRRHHASELQGTPQTDWTEPVYSEAAGVHPDQVPEMRRRFPHHEFTKDGRMIFRSRAHQKRCLRDIGMIDKDSYG